MKYNTNIFLISSIILLLLLLAFWSGVFYLVPIEKNQGAVYKIIYLHVPAAISSMLIGVILFYFGVRGLLYKDVSNLLWIRSSAEIGFLFTVITILTGSIWGKATWGVWWAWDARLTTTLLLCVLYVSLLLIYHNIDDFLYRLRVSSVMGILIFINIPIIYKSVEWWRTLHQPPSLINFGKNSNTSSAIYYPVMISIFLMILLQISLMIARVDNLKLWEKVKYNLKKYG